jgi:hypothetical protein
VGVVPDEGPAPATSLEFVLTGGRRPRVTPGFDPASLRQLLAVLFVHNPPLLIGGRAGADASRTGTIFPDSHFCA